jgi:hypothetical protein
VPDVRANLLARAEKVFAGKADHSTDMSSRLPTVLEPF